MAEQSNISPEIRSGSLAFARKELTSIGDFTQLLESALKQIKSSNQNLNPMNKDDFRVAIDAVGRIAKKALGGEEVPSNELLQDLSETYFSLGERLSPFYGGFAKWASSFRADDKPNEFIFQGRDSLGLLVGFTQLFGSDEVRYSPITRYSYHFYGLKTPEGQQQLSKIQAEYQAKGSLDKKQIFVDFGFKGTNPRKELLLVTKLFGRTPDADILLAYHDLVGNDCPELNFIWNNFERGERQKYKEVNASTLKKTAGYINTFFPETAQIMHDDSNFRMGFQELSSYIKESPDASRDISAKGSDFVVLPVYELASKYSFLRGVISRFKGGVDTSQEAIKESLDGLYGLYSTAPNLFSSFQDFTTRYAFNPQFRELIDGLNKNLQQTGQIEYKG